MNNNRKNVVVYSGFDNLMSHDIRFLQEASRFGFLYVFLWNDEFIRSVTGVSPKFPEKERLYLLESIRFVHKVSMVTKPSNNMVFSSIQKLHPSAWFVRQDEDNSEIKTFCEKEKIEFRILKKTDIIGFPNAHETELDGESKKKILVTGCFDWFHSGHVRFFEEASEMGDLYVVVGNDANVRALKGPNHPMFPQEERRFMVESIRYVKMAYVSTGRGWLDAEPEIRKIKTELMIND